MQHPTSIPPATSDGTETDPTRRYRCRHVFTDGHRCGSSSLRQQELCYYHHASRRGPSGGRGHFLMPRIDDRPAIQIAIYDILARIALGELELKPAGMLLYGLQIAASNLSQHEKALRSAPANPEPLVEDVVSNPFLGDLAPIEEIPDTNTPGAPCQTASSSDVGLPLTEQPAREQPATAVVIPDLTLMSCQPVIRAEHGSCLASRARISRNSRRRVAKCFSFGSQSVNHPNCESKINPDFSPETCSLAASGSRSSAAAQRPQFANS